MKLLFTDYLVVRIILAAIFFVLLMLSLIPVTLGIYNIGVYVSVGGFGAMLLAVIFWNYVRAAIIYLWSTAFKWPLAIIAGVLSLMLLGAIIISIMMLSAMNNAQPKGNQTLIVLGCEVRGERPSLMLQGRLDKAYEYLIDNPESLCIVSGGQGERERISEAAAMKKYLADKGIDPTRIIEEDASTNTRENLEFSKRIMDEMGLPDDAVIVTDGFHEWRAQQFAKMAGIKATGMGCKPYWRLQICFWIREIFGVVRLMLLGY